MNLPAQIAIGVTLYFLAGLYVATYARALLHTDNMLAWFFFWPILLVALAVRGLWHALKGE